MPHVFPLEEQIQTELVAWTCTAPPTCMTHSTAAGQRRQHGGREAGRGGEKWKGEERRAEGWGIFFLDKQSSRPAKCDHENFSGGRCLSLLGVSVSKRKRHLAQAANVLKERTTQARCSNGKKKNFAEREMKSTALKCIHH